MATRVDLRFQHNYEIEVDVELPGLPGAIELFYFPGAKTEGGKDGITVRVMPAEGRDWIGIFGYGHYRGNQGDGIFAFPDGQSLLVVSGGSGYIVDSGDPSIWQEVASCPIREVHAIDEKKILILADFSDLTAYGPSGLRWRRRVVWDELSITSATAQYLTCRGWDAPTSKYIELAIDVDSGNAINL